MQSRLLLRGEKVDPCRENGLNGIRDGGLSRHEPFVPPIAMECASLNQRSEQFLEKQRVALRSAEQVADRRGSLGRHELFEPPVDVSGGERLEQLVTAEAPTPVRDLLGRAEGNPPFLAELFGTLIERGALHGDRWDEGLVPGEPAVPNLFPSAPLAGWRGSLGRH